MKADTTVMAPVAVLVPPVPISSDLPGTVGLPLTGQVTVWPSGMLPGDVQGVPLGLMVQAPMVNPLGKPVTVQGAASASAVPLFSQVNVPL